MLKNELNHLKGIQLKEEQISEIIDEYKTNQIKDIIMKKQEETKNKAGQITGGSQSYKKLSQELAKQNMYLDEDDIEQIIKDHSKPDYKVEEQREWKYRQTVTAMYNEALADPTFRTFGEFNLEKAVNHIKSQVPKSQVELVSIIDAYRKTHASNLSANQGNVKGVVSSLIKERKHIEKYQDLVKDGFAKKADDIGKRKDLLEKEKMKPVEDFENNEKYKEILK